MGAARPLRRQLLLPMLLSALALVSDAASPLVAERIAAVRTNSAAVLELALRVLPGESGDSLSITAFSTSSTSPCFKVKSASGRNVFIKQVKDVEKLRHEVTGMAAYSKIMSNVVPQILGKDEVHNLLASELLDDEEFTPLQLLLERGEADRDLALFVGTTMGRSHARSHGSITTEEQKSRYADLYANENSIASSRESLLLPAMAVLDSESGKADLHAHGITERAIDEMRTAFALLLDEFVSNRDSLIHGDLFSENVLVRPDDGLVALSERCKVVDFEDCRLGSPGLDLGMFLSNYFYYYVAHSNPSTRRNLRDGVSACLGAYRSAFRVQMEGAPSSRTAVGSPWVDVDVTVDGIFREGLGFACLYSLLLLLLPPLSPSRTPRPALSLEATPGYRWGDVEGRATSVRRRHLRLVHAGLSLYLDRGSAVTVDSFVRLLTGDDTFLNSDHQTEFWF